MAKWLVVCSFEDLELIKSSSYIFNGVFGCCKCNRSHFFSGNGKRNCSHINCFYVNPKPQCRCHNLLNWIKLILIVKCFHMLKRTLSAEGENETEQNDVKVHKMQPKNCRMHSTLWFTIYLNQSHSIDASWEILKLISFLRFSKWILFIYEPFHGKWLLCEMMIDS